MSLPIHSKLVRETDTYEYYITNERRVDEDDLTVEMKRVHKLNSDVHWAAVTIGEDNFFDAWYKSARATEIRTTRDKVKTDLRDANDALIAAHIALGDATTQGQLRNATQELAVATRDVLIAVRTLAQEVL